jgi:hypothetical protein
MAARKKRLRNGIGRLGWRKIRIPYYVLKGAVFLLVLAFLIGGGSAIWSRHRGEESFIGRVLKVATRTVDQRIKLLTVMAPGEEILEQRFASLTFYSGNVDVQRAAELNWKPASEKMRLESGDRIRTFSNSRAEVTFDEGNTLHIKPDSLIVIGDLTENVRTKVRKSSVRLLVSSIEADIKKSVVRGSQFRLEMPTAVAEVEKARFSVDVGEEESRVRVFEGKVGLDTGTQRIELDDRKTVMISALKQLTRPTTLLPPPALGTPRPLQRFFTNSDAIPLEVRWDTVPGGETYRLEIATDRYFDKVVLSRAGIRKTRFQVPELGGNVFFLRVAAEDGQKRVGDFSEPVPFRIIVDRVPPHLKVTKFVVLKSGSSREVLVNGQTEPFATVQVGGRSVNVDESGFFSVVIKKFAPGQKEIEIVARDRAGNIRNLRRAVST